MASLEGSLYVVGGLQRLVGLGLIFLFFLLSGSVTLTFGEHYSPLLLLPNNDFTLYSSLTLNITRGHPLTRLVCITPLPAHGRKEHL
jgi:hypothetical protein